MCSEAISIHFAIATQKERNDVSRFPTRIAINSGKNFNNKMKLKMYKRFILGKIGELCKFIWYTLEFQYENQLHLIYRHFILLLNPLVMSFLPRLLRSFSQSFCEQGRRNLIGWYANCKRIWNEQNDDFIRSLPWHILSLEYQWTKLCKFYKRKLALSLFLKNDFPPQPQNFHHRNFYPTWYSFINS